MNDNHGLFKALSERGNVLPLFIFDTNILDKLEDRNDRRVDLIHQRLQELHDDLRQFGSSILVEHGEPGEVWSRLVARYDITAVTANHDHEPYARERDKSIGELLRSKGIEFNTYKDISVFERDEVMKDDGTPYTVYTPYMKKWRALFKPDDHARNWPSEDRSDRYHQTAPLPLPSLEDIGFKRTNVQMPARELDLQLLSNYHETRDIPSVNGTSRMSVNLRFGMVSIRELFRNIWATEGVGPQKYLNELIWREFYMQILWHFPRYDLEFKKEYRHIAWRHDEQGFQQWCEGRTGYPLVDAGMRELNATGFMHNRIRMVTASFLTKHLLIDWRWGEAYFAQKLLDFELSTNNGSWQWAASTGCDAVPYFRIFNPHKQMERYDPQLIYVKHWLPEIKTANYVHPMVVHEEARQRAIGTFKQGLSAPLT